MICDFSDKKIGKKIGPRARWRGETRDFAEICSKSSLSASEIAKFSPAGRLNAASSNDEDDDDDGGGGGGKGSDSD